MMNGFNISQQKKEASVEDQGTAVPINGMDGSPMYYMDAEGKEKPVTITVLGVHSKQYRLIQEQQRRQPLSRKKLTADYALEQQRAMVSACTLTWEGIFDGEGESAVPVPATKQNFLALYKQCEFVLDQLVEAMNDHSRFTESSLPTQ